MSITFTLFGYPDTATKTKKLEYTIDKKDVPTLGSLMQYATKKILASEGLIYTFSNCK